MLLILETMGCGRSKQQSPTNVGQEMVDGSREKPGTGKKKKSKGDKKENKAPKSGSTDILPATNLSPTKSSNKALVPMCTINGSSQNALNVDVEFPPLKDKPEKTPGSKSRDAVTTKQTNIRVTSSQLEFFKMLDEKIEQGREYRSQDELNVSTP